MLAGIDWITVELRKANQFIWNWGLSEMEGYLGVVPNYHTKHPHCCLVASTCGAAMSAKGDSGLIIVDRELVMLLLSIEEDK